MQQVVPLVPQNLTRIVSPCGIPAGGPGRNHPFLHAAAKIGYARVGQVPFGVTKRLGMRGVTPDQQSAQTRTVAPRVGRRAHNRMPRSRSSPGDLLTVLLALRWSRRVHTVRDKRPTASHTGPSLQSCCREVVSVSIRGSRRLPRSRKELRRRCTEKLRTHQLLTRVRIGGDQVRTPYKHYEVRGWNRHGRLQMHLHQRRPSRRICPRKETSTSPRSGRPKSM